MTSWKRSPSPRSIWPSIALLTPVARAARSRLQPFARRSALKRGAAGRGLSPAGLAAGRLDGRRQPSACPLRWLRAEPGGDQRDAALVTLLFTASGVTLLGIGSAFWGLVAGLAMLGLDAWRR